MTEIKVSSLNRLFSRNTFRHLINFSEDHTYNSVVRRYVDDPENKKNSELISEIYCELKNNYRNEYFYKNTLLNKLLLKVHSVNTTTALTEIPVAKSKADFVLINGKAIVYEIKTILDNFERLESQVNDYYKAFNHVAIVTCPENLKALQKKLLVIEKPVGIYILQKNGVLSTIQKPLEYNNSLDHNVLFKMLRKQEYENIIINKFGELPKVSQFNYYSECKRMFSQILLNEAYELVLKQLKLRAKIEKELFAQVPYELKFLVYFMGLKNVDYKRLDNFLKENFGGV